MLTFENIGKPIAILHDKNKKKHIISLVDDEKYKKLIKTNKFGEKLFGVEDFFWRVTGLEDNEYFEPYPGSGTRECIYVAGPSGSGKSTYVSKYAKNYNSEFPNNDIFVFSRVDRDPTLDRIRKMKRILIDDELLTDPLQASDFKDCLIIFDDIDTIPNKEIKKAIVKLREDILETGRHSNIYVAITNHMIANYQETRKLLNESHQITVFPKSGGKEQIKKVFNYYIGLEKKKIDTILNDSTESRWITLCKHAPMYILTEKSIFLIL